MRSNSPASYEYCKTEVYDGQEFCNESQALEIPSLVSQAYAQSFTSTDYYHQMQNIESGVATEESVTGVLGEPTERLEEEGKTVLVYPSDDPTRNNLVHIENGIVSLVQIIPPSRNILTLVNIINERGVPESRSYTKHGTRTLVYAYPTQGISFHFIEAKEQLLMIHQYAARTPDEFNQTLGTEYTEAPLKESFAELAAIKQQLIDEQTPWYKKGKNMQVIIFVLLIITIGLGALFFKQNEKKINDYVAKLRNPHRLKEQI